MSILPIYLYGSEVLRKKAKPIRELDDSIIKLMVDLAQTMRKANGIGLAATQVGVLRRMLVIDLSAIERAERDEEEEEEDLDAPPPPVKTLVVINPEVVQQEGTCTLEEGCLSIPELRAEVTRAEKIRVRFRDSNFEETEIEGAGMLARVMLHEIDHLDGVLFTDRVGKTRRALLRGELKKIEKGEVDTSYPAISSVEV